MQMEYTATCTMMVTVHLSEGLWSSLLLLSAIKRQHRHSIKGIVYLFPYIERALCTRTDCNPHFGIFKLAIANIRIGNISIFRFNNNVACLGL
jgi:hypothetical protein